MRKTMYIAFYFLSIFSIILIFYLIRHNAIQQSKDQSLNTDQNETQDIVVNESTEAISPEETAENSLNKTSTEDKFEDEFKVANSISGEVTFEYPKEWVLEVTEQNMVIRPKEVTTDDTQDIVQTVSISLIFNDSSADTIIDAFKSLDLIESNAGEPEKVEILDEDGLQFEYSDEENTYTAIIFLKDGILYNLKFNYEDEVQWEAYFDVFHRVKDTLQIIKLETAPAVESTVEPETDLTIDTTMELPI